MGRGFGCDGGCGCVGLLAQFPAPLKDQAPAGLKRPRPCGPERPRPCGPETHGAQPLLFRGAGNCARSPTGPAADDAPGTPRRVTAPGAPGASTPRPAQ
ncbi:hypothetical protein CVT30_27510 [Streptomyces sp. AMCC400023]|nr:hypothetical protein CVT30_27510 [Streptomyces sp. AMCC400023]